MQSNNGMQRTALRAAADAERWAGATRHMRSQISGGIFTIDDVLTLDECLEFIESLGGTPLRRRAIAHLPSRGTGKRAQIAERWPPTRPQCYPDCVMGLDSMTLLPAVHMGIQKQEFYEGAALHQLIRGSSGMNSIAHTPPFFVFNGNLQVHLKYSTAKRSPWGFTFLPDEQVLLRQRAQEMPLVIGLICGPDGVAAVPYEDYSRVARVKDVALRVSCRRNHREHFEIVGPDGTLPGKVAPSAWIRLLAKRGRQE